MLLPRLEGSEIYVARIPRCLVHGLTEDLLEGRFIADQAFVVVLSPERSACRIRVLDLAFRSHISC